MINIKLNKNLIDSFKENGFLILDQFLDLKFLDELRDRFEPLFKGEFETNIEPDEWNWKPGKDPEDVTRQICNAWKSDNLIKKIVCHKIIGKSCANLMDWQGARLIQDNILWKPPQGKTLGYHQDAAYEDWIIPQTMISCWMSLDATSKDTGTLEYVKGSHKWGLQPPRGEFHSPEDYKKELNIFAEKNNKNIEISFVEVPAGGVAFHHGFTWHGSGENISNVHRRAIVAHCVPSYSKLHPTNNGGTANIYKKYKKDNSDKLEDNFFPLLWESDKIIN